MKEISLEDIEKRFELSLGLWCKSPIVQYSTGEYQIRIKSSVRINYKTGSGSVSWDYFITDIEGIVKKSPRGYAKEFNKKVKIIDIKKRYDIYENLKAKKKNDTKTET